MHAVANTSIELLKFIAKVEKYASCGTCWSDGSFRSLKNKTKAYRY
jgi:hypothetical protein